MSANDTVTKPALSDRVRQAMRTIFPRPLWRRGGFSAAESFAWFIAGLDSLYLYVEESERTEGRKVALERHLKSAIEWLQRCVDRYPKDALAAGYLSIARTLENHHRVAAALEDAPQEVLSGEAIAGHETPATTDTASLDRAIATAQDLGSQEETLPDPVSAAVRDLNLAQMYVKRDKSGDLEQARQHVTIALKSVEGPDLNSGLLRRSVDESRAAALQAEILKDFIDVRLSLRRGTANLDEPGRAAMTRLTSMESQLRDERIPASTRAQLEADYWTKVGFLQWELAVAAKPAVLPQTHPVRTGALAGLVRARESLNKALAAKPGWSPALLTLARVEFAENDHQRARQYIRQITGGQQSPAAPHPG